MVAMTVMGPPVVGGATRSTTPGPRTHRSRSPLRARPSTDMARVDRYGAAMAGPRYGTVDVDLARRFATTAPEDDGPIWMVNLMAHRERADYGDGASDLSG